MSRINQLADRLIARLAPRMTAEAACIFIERICVDTGRNCSGGRDQLVCNTYYDNCPTRETYICR